MKCTTLPASVTTLQSCLMLNLHDVSPLQDAVQQRVAENLSAMAREGRTLRQYFSSVLRGIMFVHATRKYELSAILRGRDLLQEEDVYEVIRRRRDADLAPQGTT